MKIIVVVSILLFTMMAQAYDLKTYLIELDKKSASSVGEAVAVLPEEIRSHFTLMHTGHGLRGTSYLEPAVLAFDPKGSFFVNVGSPNQHAGDEIEVIQYNSKKHSLEMYSFSLPLKHDALGGIVMPEKNPIRCLTCHGDTPKLLWGEYDRWIGAYGNSKFDNLNANQEEAKYFQDFLNYSKNSEPYSSLVMRSFPDPYNNGKESSDFSKRPNTILGMLSSHLNAIVMARQVEMSPMYQEYRFDVLYDVAKCDRTRSMTKTLRSMGLETEFKRVAITDGSFYSFFGVQHGYPALVAQNLLNKLIESGEKDLEGTFTTYKLFKLINSPYLATIDEFGLYLNGSSALCEKLKTKILIPD